MAVLARGRKTPWVTWTLAKSPEPSPQLPRSIGRAQQNHQKRKKWTTESGGGGLGEKAVGGRPVPGWGGGGVQAEAAAWSLLPLELSAARVPWVLPRSWKEELQGF